MSAVLSSPAGSLKDAGTTPLAPVINMIDTPLLQRQARAAAEEALSLTDRFDRVVLTAMKSDPPYLEIVRRSGKSQ